MTVRVDGSYESYVVHCDDCPYFSEMRTDKLQALSIASLHEQSFHPEQSTAVTRLSKYRATLKRLVG